MIRLITRSKFKKKFTNLYHGTIFVGADLPKTHYFKIMLNFLLYSITNWKDVVIP